MSSSKKTTIVKEERDGKVIVTKTVTTSIDKTPPKAAPPAALPPKAKPTPMPVAPQAKPTPLPPAQKAKPTPTTPLSFQQQVLAEHNRYRAKHSAPPLKLSPVLNRHANEWANILAAENRLYRANGLFGENLLHFSGNVTFDGTYPVKRWFDQIKDHKFGQPSPAANSSVHNFTQVVWKESKELGVGMAKNGKNIYVVCNYNPRGNVNGKFATNVTKS